MQSHLSILNRCLYAPGIRAALLLLYALSLVLFEWLHALGTPSDLYLLMVRLWYAPIVWLIDHDCCPWWLEELLKAAAAP